MHLRVEALSKRYELDGHDVAVWNALDFEIPSGAMVSVTGPSGVGKSTLLHILGTLDAPTSGRVYADDVNLFALSDAELAAFRNKSVGFVFQFHHLLPEFSARENVMMPALIQRRPDAEVRARAEHLLDMVGLKDRMDHRPGELSGGEQQRVALARALVNHPRLLLADEPTGNLDEKTGGGIYAIMQRFAREEGVTTVIVTHNPRLAASAPLQLELGRDGVRWAERDV